MEKTKTLTLTFDEKEMEEFKNNDPSRYEVWDYQLVSIQIGDPIAAFIRGDKTSARYKLNRGGYMKIVAYMKKRIPSLTCSITS